MCRVRCLPLSILVVFIAACRNAVEETPAKALPAVAASPISKIADKDESRESIRFVNIAANAGVDFSYLNGEEADQFAILESLGGGVAIFDFDGDDDLDLFFPGGGLFDSTGQPRGRPPSLYRQSSLLQFQSVTSLAGIDESRYYSHGAAVGDADNDGFPDVIVTGYGGLSYYRNLGDGTFSESAGLCGLSDDQWSSSAAWGDLNEDGVLDLFVAHYVNWSPTNNPACTSVTGDRRDICSPRQFEPLPDVIYFGTGDGNFRDGNQSARLTSAGKGLGVLIADIDWDGHQDVYVANDTVANFLYRNDGTGRLEDISSSSGTAVNERGLPDGSMGVDVGDFNLDGLPDLWVSNYERESFAVYRNFGQGLFRHVSQAMGVTAVGARFVGWGSVCFDVDCDGDEDVFVSTGHVIRFPETAEVRQTPLLFENLHGRRFEDVASRAGDWMASQHAGRGCASGDLDHDGDLDVVASCVNEPVAVLINETSTKHHWVQVRLIGLDSTRDAQGARVILKTNLGTQSRQVKGGGSYGSTGSLDLHFGLGLAEQILEIVIHWPNGMIQSISDGNMNCRHVWLEPSRTATEIR